MKLGTRGLPILAGLILVLTIAFFGTSLGQTEYIDYNTQGTTPTQVEHGQFYKEYSNSMTPTPNSGLAVYGVSSVANGVSTAVAKLNAVRPTAVAPSSYTSTQANADVEVFYNSCPGYPSSYACTDVAVWYVQPMHDTATWKEAEIYIKPDSSGSVWSSASLSGVIAHEILHLHGLDDRYVGGGCNNGVYTLMETYFTDVYGVRQNCDTDSPTTADTNAWKAYKNQCCYTFEAGNIWGDGTLYTTWYDYGWSDFYARGAFQYWNGSAWINGYIGTGTGWVGSHYNVPGAGSWRAYLSANLAFYGISNRSVRVCGVPLFNYFEAGNWTCSNNYWYGVY